jgi:DNA polymerase-3 subunit epsilon
VDGRRCRVGILAHFLIHANIAFDFTDRARAMSLPEPDDFAALAERLAASPDHRVLRRLVPRTTFADAGDAPLMTAIVLDVETTGTDTARDEVIELAMLRFQYTRAGTVVRVTGRFDALREPAAPLADEIVRLTGLTDAMLAGQAIDDAAVTDFVASATLVIAHNARFDRPFCERLWPVFRDFAWACSLDEIPWAEEGFEGTKLGYLLNRIGLFHDGHRAGDDCAALLELLATPLPLSGRSGLSRLLETARRPTVRIWADHAPYEMKEVLKRRRYRWSDGSDGTPRAWYVDVAEAAADAEEAFLRAEVYGRADIALRRRRMTARDRFALR